MTELWPEILFALTVASTFAALIVLLMPKRRKAPPAPAPGQATALFLYRETSSLYGTVPNHGGRLPKTVIAPAPAGEGFRIGQLEQQTVGRSHLVYREIRVYPFVIGSGTGDSAIVQDITVAP